MIQYDIHVLSVHAGHNPPQSPRLLFDQSSSSLPPLSSSSLSPYLEVGRGTPSSAAGTASRSHGSSPACHRQRTRNADRQALSNEQRKLISNAFSDTRTSVASSRLRPVRRPTVHRSSARQDKPWTVTLPVSACGNQRTSMNPHHWVRCERRVRRHHEHAPCSTCQESKPFSFRRGSSEITPSSDKR